MNSISLDQQNDRDIVKIRWNYFTFLEAWRNLAETISAWKAGSTYNGSSWKKSRKFIHAVGDVYCDVQAATGTSGRMLTLNSGVEHFASSLWKVMSISCWKVTKIIEDQILNAIGNWYMLLKWTLGTCYGPWQSLLLLRSKNCVKLPDHDTH